MYRLPTCFCWFAKYRRISYNVSCQNLSLQIVALDSWPGFLRRLGRWPCAISGAQRVVGRFWENAGEITSQFVFQHGKLGPNKQLKLINRYVCLHVLISVQFTQDLQKKTIGTLHWLYPHSHLKQSVYSYSHRYDRYVFIVFSVLRIYKHIYSQLV